jgi:hypothetical protein
MRPGLRPEDGKAGTGSFDAGIPQNFLESPCSLQRLWHADRFTAGAQPNLVPSPASVPKISAAMNDKEPSELPVRH